MDILIWILNLVFCLDALKLTLEKAFLIDKSAEKNSISAWSANDRKALWSPVFQCDVQN